MVVLIYLFMFAVYCLLLIDTKKGILAAVIIRPLIDCFWQAKDIMFGVKPTEINGVVLPLLILFKILISQDQKFFRSRFSVALAGFSFYQVYPGILISFDSGGLQALNYLFRTMHTFVGFVMFQEFFHEREDFKKLLLAFIIAGLFPLGMSFYQNILGGGIRTEETIAGLVRNIGFYHDAYTLRYYSLQTLAALILFGAYFVPPGQVWLRGGLVTVGLFCIYTIYRIYSKAGYLILAQWMTIWLLAKKKIIVLILLLLAGIITVMVTPFSWVEDIQEVYSKEVGAIQGEAQVESAFQGRVGGWLSSLENWGRQPLHVQLFGSGTTALGAHNDFLRALLATGIVGLILYMMILGWAIAIAFLNCIRDTSPLNIMALMLLIMWLIDAMGLVPGGYPGYQILVWGFVGLAFRGVSGLEDVSEVDEC